MKQVAMRWLLDPLFRGLPRLRVRVGGKYSFLLKLGKQVGFFLA